MGLTIKILLFFVGLFLLIGFSEGSCYQFGHACFGAHGKRSDTRPPSSVSLQEEFDTAEAFPSYSDYPSGLDLEEEAMNNHIRRWMDKIREEMKQTRSSPIRTRIPSNQYLRARKSL